MIRINDCRLEQVILLTRTDFRENFDGESSSFGLKSRTKVVCFEVEVVMKLIGRFQRREVRFHGAENLSQDASWWNGSDTID